MISLKGSHFPRDAVLYAVFFYVRYSVSYRDLEEIMAERGVKVDYATLNRWVVKYSPLVGEEARGVVAEQRPPGILDGEAVAKRADAQRGNLIQDKFGNARRKSSRGRGKEANGRGEV